MANEKLEEVKGVDGLFTNPRGQYVVKTSAVSEKIIDPKTGRGKLLWGKLTVRKPNATKEDALRALAEVKERLRYGTSDTGPAGPIPTVRAYAPSWSARQLAKRRWTAESGTARVVGWRFDTYVVPNVSRAIMILWIWLVPS